MKQKRSYAWLILGGIMVAPVLIPPAWSDWILKAILILYAVGFCIYFIVVMVATVWVLLFEKRETCNTEPPTKSSDRN